MIIVACFLAFLAGLLAGAVLAVRVRRARRVDYRERWLQAVTLLGDEGRLTDEQVASLRGSVEAAPVAQESAPVAQPAGPSAQTLRMLHGMYSDDRRKAEVTRAQKGLPPLDDLKGMYSDDIRKVMQARTEYGTG